MHLNRLSLFGLLLWFGVSCSQVVQRLEGLPHSLAIYLGEVRSQANLTSSEDEWRDRLCLYDLEQFGEELQRERGWALQMYDSWGKLPSGLLSGNSFTLGNFDQCRRLSVHNAAGIFRGQHCTVRFGLQAVDRSLDELWMGICVPDSCEAKFLKLLVDQFTLENGFGVAEDHNLDQFCNAEDSNKALSGTTIAALVILGAIAVIMIACTVMEVLGFIFQRTVSEPFKELSLYHKLFALFSTIPKTKEKTDTLDCINGIRSIMMLQIISHHVHDAIRSIPTTNHFVREEYFQSAMGIISYRTSALSADVFLVLSSLLLTYNVLKELSDTAKLSLARIWIHRLCRILPAYGFLIFSVVAFAEYFGEGPLFDYYVAPLVEACSENWWSALLFVQNYVNPDKMCLPHTWHLSVDMQLYLISPLIVYLFWRYGNRILIGIIGLALLSMACVFTSFILNDFVLNPAMTPTAELERDRLTYYSTHTRMAVWFCGMAFGILLFNTRGKRIIPPPTVLVGGSIAATALTGFIMFCAYEIYRPRTADPLGDAFYEAFHRVAWVLCIMWLIFMCINGHASALGHFLAWTFWQPVARLSYGMYLIHYVVIAITFSGGLRQPFFFSEINLQYVNLGVIGLSGVLSLVWWLFIEQPFQIAERYICQRIRQSRQ